MNNAELVVLVVPSGGEISIDDPINAIMTSFPEPVAR
jgi:hypothetical protein